MSVTTADGAAPPVIPAKGHPAKYDFAGTPKAGISGREVTARLHETPASAGVTKYVAPLAALLLAACATQSAAAVEPAAPGFLLGLWHGFIFPVAWILSLFMPDVSVYAVPNNGGWYDFGFFLGVVVLGVGARKTRTVYRYRVVREDGTEAPR